MKTECKLMKKVHSYHHHIFSIGHNNIPKNQPTDLFLLLMDQRFANFFSNEIIKLLHMPIFLFKSGVRHVFVY